LSGRQAPARVFHAGSRQAARKQVGELLGRQVTPGWPDPPLAGDLVLIEPDAQGAPYGNAFCALRAFKEVPGVRAIVLVAAGDQHAQALARFCQADACIGLLGDDLAGDHGEVRETLLGTRRHVSVDDLLARYEQRLGEDSGKRASGLHKLLSASGTGSVMSQWTDAETGLFDAPFASFKIDEELKRANRMNQPLTLVLLDIGVAEQDLPRETKAKRMLLAEVASVFLNSSRDIDVLARFTPTTFLFLLPGTGQEGGLIASRRMIEGLRQRSPIGGVTLDPRAGLVTVPCAGIEHREAFLMRAEDCLERARSGQGGSGVCASLE